MRSKSFQSIAKGMLISLLLTPASSFGAVAISSAVPDSTSAPDSTSVRGPIRDTERFPDTVARTAAAPLDAVSPKRRPVLEGAVLGFTVGFLGGAVLQEARDSGSSALLAGLAWGIIGAFVGAGIGAISR